MRISDWSSDVCSSDLSRGLRRLTFILHVGFSSERFRYLLGGGTCGWLGRRRRFLRDGFGGLALQRIRQLLDQTAFGRRRFLRRSEEHTSELQSLMRISYAVFCLKKKQKKNTHYDTLT